MNLWPHQQRGIIETLSAIDRGDRRICLMSPTGGGKTRIVCEIIEAMVKIGWGAALYTNRKMLIDQLSDVLTKHGIMFGTRAAGHETQLHRPVQISSLPTESERVLKAGKWRVHGGGRRILAIIDEAHLNMGYTARAISEQHLAEDGVLLGVTATPIGMAPMYDTLIVAGTNSELRDCGALVPCEHYGPDEPDFRAHKKLLAKLNAGADPSENEVRKVMMTPTLFGRVWEWFERLNPDHKPTLLFAPGVRESLWFAEQFVRKGVSAAHIDGQDVWVNGELYRSSQSARADVMEGSRDGRIRVVCNRFVLREGIDAPWLSHGILATVFGSLQSYLQSGGRLLRSHADISAVTIQDHGGNYLRHGSLNADRTWRLDQSANMIAGLRANRIRRGEEQEPFRCPQCAIILMSRVCKCGFRFVTRSRMVVTTDGHLSEYKGDFYKPRVERLKPNTAQIWTKCYFRAKNSKTRMTFRQAEALFVKENHYWPPHNLKRMPVEEEDWFRAVADVPDERLIQGEFDGKAKETETTAPAEH